MNAFLVIASREVTTRTRVLAASVALGLVPLLAPLLLTTGASPAEVRGAGAWSASLLLGTGVAILAGAALFGAPLAEGRTGFWLSRPASTTAIWGGKLAGASVLVLLASTLAILPGAIVGRMPFNWAEWPGLLALNVGLGLFFLLLSAAASVAIRSRSAWVAADLLFLGLTSFLAWKALETAAWVGLFDSSWFAFAGATGKVAIVLAPVAALLSLGTWAAVARGRGDIRLAHRAQAIFFWAPLLGLTVLLLGASAWYAYPPISALKVGWIEAVGSDGEWILAGGSARNRPGAFVHFLVHAPTGKSLRIDRSGWAVTASDDGSRAAFLRPVSLRGKEVELVCVDLKSPRLAETVVPGSFPSSRGSIVPSPDGSMLALGGDGTLSVVGLPSGRLLGSVSLPKEAGSRPDFVFRGSSVLVLPHVYVDASTSARVEKAIEHFAWSFDLGTRRLSSPLRLDIAPAAAGVKVVLSPDGHRLLAKRFPPRDLPVDVLDAGTGRLAFRIAPSDGTRLSRSGFLADGSVFAVERSETSTKLRILGADGVERAPIPLPGGRVRFEPGCELRPGILSGSISRETGSGELANERPRLVVVDVSSARVVETGDRARPVYALGWPLGSPGSRMRAGSPVSHIFQEGETLLTGIPGEGPLVPLALH